jgi:RNA polymerase sigma-70 factor (sigma-E family)
MMGSNGLGAASATSPRAAEDVVGVSTAELDVAALFRGQWRPMVRLAVLLLDDLGAAEDVVQDAFVALQHNRRVPSDPQAAVAYLRTTVVNRSRSALRHRYVVSRFRQRQTVLPNVEPASAIDENDATLRALRALPQRQREVLVLRYWADLTHADIAQTLGIAEGSAKSAASRGLAALRNQLEEA